MRRKECLASAAQMGVRHRSERCYTAAAMDVTQNVVPQDYPAWLWHWLEHAPEQWTPIDLQNATASQQSSFMRLVLSGQFQLRLHVIVRGTEDAIVQPTIRATCIVLGDYKKALLQTLRGIAPQLGNRLVAESEPPESLESLGEYRLSTAGQQTREEMLAIGAGDVNWLATTLAFAIPGVANVVEWHTQSPEPAHPAPVEPTTADEPPSAVEVNGKREDENDQSVGDKTPDWPVSKTEGHVAAYLSTHHEQYLKLAADVLDDRTGARDAFGKIFGPTAIAREITCKSGAGAQRVCRAQDVDKTYTYKNRIQPLFKRPPRKPEGWEQKIAQRMGEDLPDLLEEIPFEDED